MQPPEPTAPQKPVSRFAEFAPKPVTPAVAEHPSTPYSREFWCRRFGAPFPDDFVEMINPTATTIRALVFLGPPSKPLQAPRPDDDDGDVDATPSAARRAYALAYNRSLWTLIEFPAGARLQIPRSIVGALVATDPMGMTIIGGLCPQLRLVGDESNPPTLHPSLAEAQHDVEPFSVPRVPQK